jgi:hypothetical protein
MGTTQNGSLSLCAMIEDSTDEFNMTSSGEGSTACCHRNYTMARGRSDHLDYDDGFTVDPHIAARHRLAPERRHTFQDG